MEEPAYVTIAGIFARRIRNRELPAGIRIPSYDDIQAEYNVSKAVVRQAVDLLISLGLVRSKPRKGIIVADSVGLIRVSPERQLETAEETFRHESEESINVERHVSEVNATTKQVQEFGLDESKLLSHTVTRAVEGRKPVSISDTYQPLGAHGISDAVTLEETVRDQLPGVDHAAKLELEPGDLIKSVEQRFFDVDGRLVMHSKILYPRDRYEGFTFRMDLRSTPVGRKSD